MKKKLDLFNRVTKYSTRMKPACERGLIMSGHLPETYTVRAGVLRNLFESIIQLVQTYLPGGRGLLFGDDTYLDFLVTLLTPKASKRCISLYLSLSNPRLESLTSCPVSFCCKLTEVSSPVFTALKTAWTACLPCEEVGLSRPVAVR